MNIQRFNVGKRLSEIVVHGNTVYLAGEVPDDGSKDITGQTEEVLAKIDKLLKQVNSETNKDKRKKLFAQGMAVLDQTAPLYLIGFTDHLPMWRTSVKGHNSDARVFSELGRVDTFWLDR